MLAVLLLGTGLVALIQVVNTGLFLGSQNEDAIIAANLAQEKTEECRNALYSAVASEAKGVITYQTVPATADPRYAAFRRQVDVTTPQTNLKQVSVTVYWFANSSEVSTNMVTYVSNNA